MISILEYFGKWLDHKDVTDEIMDNAEKLLIAVDKLYALAVLSDISFPINPKTNSQVSGTEYGGFRPVECKQGAQPSAKNNWKGSSHKSGLGVDQYDPGDKIDDWISQFDEDGGKRNSVLEECGLYREHPDDTPNWCHLSIRPPGSGMRTFKP